MRSDDVDVLQLLVTAASQWQVDARSQNVEIDILTTRINGETVILGWDETNSIWNIRTQ